MYLNKNNGVIMLEVIVLLNILLILTVLSSKMIITNMSKFSLYEIKEDVLTLSNDEYQFLNEVKENFLINNEGIDILKKYKEDSNLEIEYEFSKNKNMKFIIKENEAFIREKNLKGHESIRRINIKVKEDDKEIEIIFIPTLYKYQNDI